MHTRKWGIICALSLMTLPCAAAPRAAPSPVTSYRQMTAQLTQDAAQSDWVRLASVGHSTRGRALWLARLADPAACPSDTVRVLVLCRQHGDEPASTEAVLRFIHKTASGNDPALRAELRRVTLYIVPMANPDGAQAGTRANSAGIDLNRDWGVFSQPETRALARAALLLQPQVVIDAHNWDAHDPYNAHCLEIARTMETPLGKITHQMQQACVADLAASGYQVHPTAFGPDADPRLAHRWFARQGLPALLVETHSGDPRDAADFQRRQGLYLSLLHGLARRLAASSPRAQAQWEQATSAHTSQDAALFPPPAARPPRLVRGGPPRYPLWAGALCAWMFILWAAGAPRSATEPKRVFVPASGMQLKARHGTRRYQCLSRYSLARPAPVACGRKR